MTQGVGQALLGDSVDDELDVRRERRQLSLELSRDARAVLGVDARAERDQRVDEAEVVERLGTQLAGDPAHLVQALPDGVRHAAQGLRRQRRVAVRRPLGLDRHRGQRLPDLVVELPRDPQPLALLCGECRARGFAPGALEPVEHGVERFRQGLALRQRTLARPMKPYPRWSR